MVKYMLVTFLRNVKYSFKNDTSKENAVGELMNKLTVTIIILGSTIFLMDVSYGIGWLLGWVFIIVLSSYREKILDYIIDFESFSAKKYILYLFGVMIWIAIPIIISLIFPKYINTLAIFSAYIIDRLLMFITKSFAKEG